MTTGVASRGDAPARVPHRPAGRLGPAVAATTGALVLIGLVMILSASSVSSFEAYGSSFLFFKRQLMWAAIGVVAFLVCARLDYRRLRGAGYVLYLIVFVLLLAVLVPGVGVVSGGSARWLPLGPVSFQPSELAKLALLLLAADVLARKREELLEARSHTIVPVVPAVAGFGILVLLQPDMGTAVLLSVIGLVVLFCAGAPMRHLAPLCAAGVAIAAVAALGEQYRRARVLAFLDPWKDPLNTGYHTIQSLIALGSGNWFGLGLGASRQKWSYVPNAHTDFIFAILGEEMGLFGTVVVVGLFAWLVYLGVSVARRAPDRFGMLLAAGITTWVGAQALVNMGAVTASLPVTGVPLPLVSFGGSSLVVLLAAMGILVNIAARCDARPRPAVGA